VTGRGCAAEQFASLQPMTDISATKTDIRAAEWRLLQRKVIETHEKSIQLVVGKYDFNGAKAQPRHDPPTQGIPAFMTIGMKRKLRERGYTEDAINVMEPKTAWEILNQVVSPGTAPDGSGSNDHGPIDTDEM